MMKHLKVEVNGQEWVNGEFTEVTFTDGSTSVRLEAKIEARAARAASSGGGLLDLLAAASKARTAGVVEEKKTALVEEKVEVIEAEPVD